MALHYDERWGPYLNGTLERAVRAYIHAEEPFRLLDVACGTGELIKRLKEKFPKASFVGIDAASGMIDRAKVKLGEDSRVKLHRASASELPFADGSFDWVTCINSLHCFSEAEAVIGQMIRVLKPRGRLLLMDWCRDSRVCRWLNQWCRWFDPTHVWMHSTQEIRRMLEKQKLLLTPADRFRLSGPGSLKLWEMVAFVGIKPLVGELVSPGRCDSIRLIERSTGPA